ncbi:MAG: AAA family ATPase [Dehalococcoidia bacterium]|nr:AAA family ATPase [Dehalococcoidia bacterium]
MEQLVDLLYRPHDETWHGDAELAFEALFGGGNRYPETALKREVQIRAPRLDSDGAPFAALINHAAPNAGAYGGMSFVVFPSVSGSTCFGLVVGTQGLSPDEDVLTRPGHARRTQAIARWLNREFGHGDLVAWAKQDPVRIDQPLPGSVASWLGESLAATSKKYGDVMYAMSLVTPDRVLTTIALKAMLDVFMAGHGVATLKPERKEAAEIEASYMAHLMPDLTGSELASMLATRRFVVVEGPPGTGKTRMAIDLIDNHYVGNGTSIQFHPNTTYEAFIGGLSPQSAHGPTGLSFYPKPGALLTAIAAARATPERPYLLHIDEINRADLAKVLGEAIYLFEPKADAARSITLEHQFLGADGQVVEMPENLHVLGTMNSADRSVAILDLAIRRRFAFVSLWPQKTVVNELACDLMKDAFDRLLNIFVDHASGEAMSLMPGHSYFLEQDTDRAKLALQTELQPLLTEYLAQGYVAGFAGEIAGYLQWIDAQTS